MWKQTTNLDPTNDHDHAVTDADVERVNSVSANGGYWSADLAPTYPSFSMEMGPEGCHRSVGCPLGLHSDIHAGIFPNRRGHELVTSSGNYFLGQSDRSRPYGSQRTCRNQIRNTISCTLPSFFWHSWCERAGHAAGLGGLWLIWNSMLDRRLGDLQSD